MEEVNVHFRSIVAGLTEAPASSSRSAPLL
jgi:hypothetical protein